MMTALEAMACGNCGAGTFRMYLQPQGSRFRLVAKCIKCKSTSVIEAGPPELRIEFGEDSDGRLCRMAPNDDFLEAG